MKKKKIKSINLKIHKYKFKVLSNQSNLILKNNFWKNDNQTTQNIFQIKKKNGRKFWGNIKNKKDFSKISDALVLSEIIFWVVDIRNPIGTWNRKLANRAMLLKKKIVVILNKADLIPSWIISEWLKIFAKRNITLICKYNVKNYRNKREFLKIIKCVQNKNLPKKNITVGVIGYPNVGKSKVISILKEKSNVVFFPKYTKACQFFRLSKRIFFINSPDIVMNSTFTRSNVAITHEQTEHKCTLLANLVKKKAYMLFKKNKSNLALREAEHTKGFKCFFKMKNNKRSKQRFHFNSASNLPWLAPIPYTHIKVRFFTMPWLIYTY